MAASSTRVDKLSRDLCSAISTGQLSDVKVLCEKRLRQFEGKTLGFFEVESVNISCRCFAIPNDIFQICTRSYITNIGGYPEPNLKKLIFAGKCSCIPQRFRVVVAVRKISPLVVACYYGHEETVRYLLEVESEAINWNGYMTPLMMTTICRNRSTGLPIAKLLLNAGADFNVTDQLSQLNSLQYAALKNNVNMIRLLLENGADVNSLEISPLLLVRHPECWKLLLEAGAKVTNENSQRCPLYYAIQDGKVERVKDYLNNSTFQKEHLYSDTDITLVQYATQCLCEHQTIKGKSKDFEILDLLLEKGLPVDSYTTVNLTKGEKRLFRKEMNIEANRSWGPATFVAAAQGRSFTLRYLLERGADLNFRNAFGVTALMVLAARKYRHFSDGTQRELDRKCLSLLTRSGIDLNAQDICGRTAIYYALRSCDEMSFILKWLLTKNVDLYPFLKPTGCTRFRRKKPLFYYACNMSSYSKIKLLIDYGYNIRKDKWLMKRKRIPPKLLQDATQFEEIETIFRNPEDLKRLCRNEIRRLLGIDIEKNLKGIQLPRILKNYLMFK